MHSLLGTLAGQKHRYLAANRCRPLVPVAGTLSQSLTVLIGDISDSYRDSLGRLIAVRALNHLRVNVRAEILDEAARLLGASVAACVAVRVATIIVHIILIGGDGHKIPKR